MRQFNLILFLSFFLVLRTPAQDLFRLTGDTPTVTVSGQEIPMPFAGGINAAQVQAFDLNGDGREELIIWDINAGRIHAYEHRENGYRYFPGAAYYFPDDVNGFLLLADFNGDGKKDLFTGSPFGIKAYRNEGVSADQFPEWVVESDFLRLENGSNLTANILDVPLIEDLDGDGDLDILTFNFATGDYLEFFKNTSIERTGQPSVDGFAAAVARWGRFEFCDCGSISFGITCAGQPIADREPTPDLLRTLHSGGHTLLYRDFDNDGTRDLLIGQDQCSVLYFLPNEGSDTEPVFEEFTTSLPGFGPLPEFPIFHSAFVLEEDLLVSSHSSEPIINTGSDFSRSMYLLQPGLSGTVETTGYLQEQMVDFGENSRPYFLGNRLQGSLFVGANIRDSKGVQGRVYELQWENNQIQLVSEDYLRLSELELLEPSYQRFTSAGNETYHVITGDVYTGQIPEKQIWLSKTRYTRRKVFDYRTRLCLAGNGPGLSFPRFQRELPGIGSADWRTGTIFIDTGWGTGTQTPGAGVFGFCRQSRESKSHGGSEIRTQALPNGHRPARCVVFFGRHFGSGECPPGFGSTGKQDL
ncbi:FG-GAP repeat domain-containing protein [Cyclobacterium xiamenense]|uniref:FG-GAP repeat domain-containing protein n=1 Tax=Cyclobacterium xiamenense TaxID=1297121 RepID=UPI0035D11031